eukprot:4400560-Alexandrium_andersonii.AAC.1
MRTPSQPCLATGQQPVAKQGRLGARTDALERPDLARQQPRGHKKTTNYKLLFNRLCPSIAKH